MTTATDIAALGSGGMYPGNNRKTAPSFLSAVKELKSELVVSARRAIIKSVIKTWDSCRRSGYRPEEPDYIASLVLNGAKDLDHEWRGIFGRHGIKVYVTGIYCHQTPKVRFNGMKGNGCELGDLLWCHFHRDKDGGVSRNAILYQAKRVQGQPVRLKVGDDQLALYTAWPAFKYTGSGILNGMERSVRPSAPRRGAQYLLIDERPPEDPSAGIVGEPGTYPFGSCIADSTLFSHADLGYELVGTLEMLSGNPFDSKETAPGDGWSEVVWDLLDTSVNRAFNRARSGHHCRPRRAGALPAEIDGCFYMSESYRGALFSGLNGGNPDGVPPERSMKNGGRFKDHDPGIAILAVESFEE